MRSTWEVGFDFIVVYNDNLKNCDIPGYIGYLPSSPFGECPRMDFFFLIQSFANDVKCLVDIKSRLQPVIFLIYFFTLRKILASQIYPNL